MHYLIFVTQNDAQYPLHHVSYTPAKFKVAMSNSLGGDDAFTRNGDGPTLVLN